MNGSNRAEAALDLWQGGLSHARIARVQDRERDEVLDDIYTQLKVEALWSAAESSSVRAVTKLLAMLAGHHDVGPAWLDVQSRLLYAEAEVLALRELCARLERERRQAWAVARSSDVMQDD